MCVVTKESDPELYNALFEDENEDEKDKEIDRLNNIINKLEKALKSHKDLKIKCHYKEYWVEVEEVLNFLQELKESK